jgi:hypothetical protein
MAMLSTSALDVRHEIEQDPPHTLGEAPITPINLPLLLLETEEPIEQTLFYGAADHERS